MRSCEAGAGYRALNYAQSIMTKILCVDDDTEGIASRKEVLESEGIRRGYLRFDFSRLSDFLSPSLAVDFGAPGFASLGVFAF